MLFDRLTIIQIWLQIFVSLNSEKEEFCHLLLLLMIPGISKENRQMLYFYLTAVTTFTFLNATKKSVLMGYTLGNYNFFLNTSSQIIQKDSQMNYITHTGDLVLKFYGGKRKNISQCPFYNPSSSLELVKLKKIIMLSLKCRDREEVKCRGVVLAEKTDQGRRPKRKAFQNNPRRSTTPGQINLSCQPFVTRD